jgi:hypothetical protein
MNNFTFLEKFTERLKDIHSTMYINLPITNFTPAKILTELTTKYKLVYLTSDYSDDVLHHKDAIFQHTSQFYIYLSKNHVKDNFELIIIYKPEQYEEIKLFINNLKKII